ncbi:diguanylate cyclase (GGDEF)-like protein [Aequitasia blattaphilus]|uniref:GGDEF domain-containing protein n=1 Tax=Aequitasia blattaphilus TaxID=2949332 RepID=A0ABT1EAM6_9FIRM|nr:GGDEF domain-containing protein [Aequitasia blattaphilus]MCP1102878.1 GGDEF domain-containing protein [Aequitasia blattaphilus]MCR8615518.1 GGDEF domain-containing protein [Aequitasia blattaphilus]
MDQSGFTDLMSAFWVSTMEKLNNNVNRMEVITDVIKDVCRYFNFGCSFVYTGDFKKEITLFSSYRAYLNFEHLKTTICLKEELSKEEYREFNRSKRIMYNRNNEVTNLAEKFSTLFNAKNLIAVPIRGSNNELIALIGMADRRVESREGDQDATFAYYILKVLGNYLKVHLSEEEAKGTLNVLNSVINNTGVDVYVVDYHSNEILYANQSAMKQMVHKGNIVGELCYKILFDDKNDVCDYCPKKEIVTKDFKPGKTKIWDMAQSDGTWRRYMSTTFYWIDGRLAQSISSVDITDHVRNKEKLERYSRYDTLTNLKNRHMLLLDCDDGLERLKKEGREGYILFCDFNKFKIINDEYGHDIGDRLLEEVGRYLGSNEKTKDRTYRYGGDEFVVLCFEETEEEAIKIREEIIKKFDGMWNIDGKSFFCSVSVGITSYPKDAKTTSDLINVADLAMYQEKKRKYQ